MPNVTQRPASSASAGSGSEPPRVSHSTPHSATHAAALALAQTVTDGRCGMLCGGSDVLSVACESTRTAGSAAGFFMGVQLRSAQPGTQTRSLRARSSGFEPALAPSQQGPWAVDFDPKQPRE